MRASSKPEVAVRPTKTSLARQSVVCTSMAPIQQSERRSLSQVSNTYGKQNMKNVVQRGFNVKTNPKNVPLKVQQQQHPQTSSGVMKNAVFKHRSVQKLAVIMSESARDNSTKESEILKQVIVSSLTETVKNLEIAVDNQENKPPKRKRSLFYPSLTGHRTLPRTVPSLHRRTIQPPTMIPPVHKELKIVAIELPSTSDNDFNDELDEDEHRINGEIYVMNYIRDIMNLLYALESHYQIDNSYLQVTSTRTTIPSKIWKMALKHRTILVEWLIQLFYCRFHLSQDSLHVCM
ncbi:unnamed protein product, partial [Didymodactylos carnosus]